MATALPQWLEKATSILTHSGAAHFDEFAACAVLLAHKPGLKIERGNMTDRKLADGRIIVVDMGGVHSPDHGQFDHHQFPRDHEPTCALTLVLEALGLLDAARKFWPWLRFKEVLDSKGPSGAAREAYEFFATQSDDEEYFLRGMNAKSLARAWDQVLAPTMSPVEDAVIRMFRDSNHIRPDGFVHGLMEAIGNDWVTGLKGQSERYDKLKYCVAAKSVAGVEVATVHVMAADRPTLALEKWLRDFRPDVAVTVTYDDRGPGLCLFRRDDPPRVDFSRLEGDRRVTFAHKSGFVAKTVAGLTTKDVEELVAMAALTGEGPPCIS